MRIGARSGKIQKKDNESSQELTDIKAITRTECIIDTIVGLKYGPGSSSTKKSKKNENE